MKLSRWDITAGILIIVSVWLQSATYGENFRNLRPGIAVWDTGELWSADLSNKDSWTRIARNQKPSSIEGDAVITNGRILAVLRKSCLHCF